ncbi:hypothetical protein C8R43DRAFT_955405 [Mycena crocata]|nr:hypothetical protein C8R43DRAFT_955405 [Mycena crocata]
MVAFGPCSAPAQCELVNHWPKAQVEVVIRPKLCRSKRKIIPRESKITVELNQIHDAVNKATRRVEHRMRYVGQWEECGKRWSWGRCDVGVIMMNWKYAAGKKTWPMSKLEGHLDQERMGDFNRFGAGKSEDILKKMGKDVQCKSKSRRPEKIGSEARTPRQGDNHVREVTTGSIGKEGRAAIPLQKSQRLNKRNEIEIEQEQKEDVPYSTPFQAGWHHSAPPLSRQSTSRMFHQRRKALYWGARYWRRPAVPTRHLVQSPGHDIALS